MAVMLELKNLNKNFDAVHVINDFSLEVFENSLCCLVGPNGAGKTTTLDLITGRQVPSSGKIILNGVDITGKAEQVICRLGIGRKFQIPAVFRELSVEQNLAVAYTIEVNPIKNIFSFSSKNYKTNIDKIADKVGLSHRLPEIAGNLSHGEIQWLEIGMLLMQDPPLLLLDEPVAGMTEGEVSKTVDILNDLKKTKTLIVVEHDMGFVRRIADVVTVMHMGSLLAKGSIEQIEKNQDVRNVYLGTEDE
ncbi:ATP-binding cassette domain-containing protein [uncultured Planktomarina sp.]|uniref:ABC transporter ATP-binding protein n=1 Tax=uncultured Planktomarina sp. TaxID=1538529 RepID=UPI003261CA93